MKIREKKIPGRGSHKYNGPRTANVFGMFEYRIIHSGQREKKVKILFLTSLRCIGHQRGLLLAVGCMSLWLKGKFSLKILTEMSYE